MKTKVTIDQEVLKELIERVEMLEKQLEKPKASKHTSGSWYPGKTGYPGLY